MKSRDIRGEEGQAALELAFILPLMAGFAFICFQMALILWAYLSVINVGRDLTRWLVVHPNTVDSTAISALQARLSPDLTWADLSVSVSPPCAALTQGKCPNRAAGNDLAVSLTYDVSSRYFIPQQFSLGFMSVQLPTWLPVYTLHMQVEPS